jgi:hypothetical protein
VFNKKFNAKGRMEKYKASLIEKGYSQVEGVGFDKILFIITNLTSIRFLLFIVGALV